MKRINNLLLLSLLASALVFSGCSDDDEPAPENEEEIITDVILSFTPISGGTGLTFTAQDPDGEGPQDIAVSGPIQLAPNTEYILTINVLNSIEGEDITEEIEEEDEEHMFFFGFTDAVFTSPAGNGNIDSRADDVDYVDTDSNGLPVGLTTTWQTADSGVSGTFRVVLKHQPDIKSATSTATDGESDIDLTWNISVQ